MANTYKATFELDAQVQGVIDGFTKIQDAAKKLNLGKAFDNKLEDMMTRLTKNGQKMSEAIQSGFKKTSDLTKFRTGMSGVESTITSIVRLIEGIDPKKLALGGPELEDSRKQLEALNEEFKKLSGEFQKGKEFKNFENFLKSVDSSKHSTKALQQFFEALKSGKIDQIDMQMKGLENTFQLVQRRSQSGSESMKFWEKAIKLATEAVEKYTTDGANLLIERDEVATKVTEQETAAFQKNEQIVNELKTDTKEYADNTHRLTSELDQAAGKSSELNTSLERFKQRATYFFGMENAVRLFRRAIRAAFNDVKELDKAMTATAVVTNFSVGDLWSQLPEYTKRANALGVSIQSAYEAATLYYQQGLKTNQVVEVSTQTLKMARIAGLDAATATDRMTNALRGFNMEINETNAQRIADVYSKLAAMSASNVDEISTAMTKVASLASNANMSFEKTAAFLSQIIETTRESAETAGTALKTVVARFSEVKELYSKGQLLGSDEEGEEINVNRVSKALQTAGINLNEYFTGMKGLDDIFMELASKWDDLDEVQQRYIATMAAGSRQQSRFIAMMQDYKRTLELVDSAERANGASAEQFAKTMESLDAKLNKLKNSWTTFTTGITNSTIIKFFVDLARTILDVVNALTKFLGPFRGLASTILAFGGLKLAKLGFDKLFASIGKAFLGAGTDAGNKFGIGFSLGMKKTSVITTSTRKATEMYNLALAETTILNNSAALSEDEKSAAENRGNIIKAVKINLDKIDISQKERNILLTAALTDEELAQTLAEEGLTAEKAKDLLVQKGLTAELNKGIFSTLKLTLAKIGGANASLIAAAATGKDAAAQRDLNKAAGRGAIAIAAVAAAIIFCTTVMKNADKSIEQANAAVEELNSTAGELSDTYDDLKDSTSDLLKSYKDLHQVVEGTETWNNKLEEVNKQINDLIEKYPQFIKYFQKDASGNWEMRANAEEGFSEELEKVERQKGLTQAATTVAGAYSIYNSASTNVMKQSFVTGLTFGANALWDKELQASNHPGQSRVAYLENKIDKGWSDALDNVEENFNAALYFTGEAGGLAEVLIDNAEVGREGVKYLDKLKQKNFWGNVKYTNWNKEDQEAFKKFAADVYGGTVDNNGKLTDASGNEIKNSWEIFATYKALQDSEELIQRAQKERISNDLLDRLLTGNITEADYQKLRNNTTGLSSDYSYLMNTMESKMLALGQGLYNADFSSDIINDLSMKAREALADTATTLPSSSRKQFAQIFTDFWSTVDERSKDKVQEAISATNFEDLDSIQTLEGALKDILGNDGDVTVFIDALEDLGIATLSIGDKINTLLTKYKKIGESIDDSTKRIDQETYDNISSDKLRGWYVPVGDEYIFIGNPQQAREGRQEEAKELISQIHSRISSVKGLETNLNNQSTTTQSWQYKYIRSLKDLSEDQMIDIFGERGAADAERWTLSETQWVKKYGQKYGLGHSMYRPYYEVVPDEWSLVQKANTYFKNNYTESYEKQKEFQEKFDKQQSQLVNEIVDLVAQGDSVLLEEFLNSDDFTYIASHEETAEAVSRGLKAQLKMDSSLYGHGTNAFRMIMGSLTNSKQLEADLEVFNKFYESLSKQQYNLKAGDLEDYNRVYAETASLMEQVFGFGSAKFINDYREIFSALVEDTDDYTEALLQLRAVLTDTDEDAKEALNILNSDYNDTNTWGQIGVSKWAYDMPIETFIQELQELGYTVTQVEDDLIVSDIWSTFFDDKGRQNKYGGSSSSDNWENPYDRLHNLLEHITSVQKERNRLEREYNKLVREPNTSYKETQQVLQKRLENLHDEYQLQKRLKEEREKDMENYYNEHQSEIEGYAYYKDGRVYIDWDALENSNFTNDEGKNIEDIISKMKELRDSRDDAADKLGEIDDEVFETRQTIIENYRNFEDRVLAAVTADEQKRIDMMSKINDSINDATDKLFDQAQKQIDEYRQTRENEKTESEIADKEARLAYLRRDTSGANALEIKKLEEELGDARQDYADSRIDQALEEMRNEADLAAEQRAEQIAIEQGILDYQKEIGYFWTDVGDLISKAFNEDGTVNWNSDLITLLQETEGFKGLSELGKAEWIKDVGSQMAQLVDEDTLRRILYGDTDPGHSVVEDDDVADGVKQGEDNHGTATSTDIGNVKASVQEIKDLITFQNNYAPESFAHDFQSMQEMWGMTEAGLFTLPGGTAQIIGYLNNLPILFERGKELKEMLEHSLIPNKEEYIDQLRAYLNPWVDKYNNWAQLINSIDGTNYPIYSKFATGGLVSSTGPAWLDGTHSNPEYVLNAAQTEGFLQLVDMFTKPQDAFSGTPGFGDNYFDIDINAEIGSDYDVDQLVERIKTRITEDSMYRNVNAINFIR